MKCPKCGFNQPEWLKQGYDREAEYCKFEDAGMDLKVKETRIFNGFAYRRTSEKWIIRLPLEIYKTRGTFNKPKSYWDPASTKPQIRGSRI